MRKYSLNENFFNSWSNEMAYFLGFIAADGCLYKYKNANDKYMLQIGLNSKDEHILLSMMLHINSNRPLVHKKAKIDKQGYNKGAQSILCLNSTQIAHDLMNLGIYPRKSWTMEFPKNYPEEFMSHYLRGFFDGDGSIYFIKHPSQKNKYLGVNFTGPEKYLRGLKNYLQPIVGKDYGYMRALKSKGGTYYQLVYSGGLTIKKILDYFYRDSTVEIRLKRKYDIYINYYSNIDVNNLKQNNTQYFNNNTETHLITAFNETKTLSEWSNDLRCVVKRQTLYHRIFDLDMEPEFALITKFEDLTIINHASDKISNNQKLTQSEVDQIRELGKVNNSKKISKKLNLNQSTVYDVLSNNTFKNNEYTYEPKKKSKILITYGNKTQTIQQWSDELNLPYSTIDRRYRQNLPIDQVLSIEALPKIKSTQSEKYRIATELALNLREDYKNGLIGKKLYEKYNIPKSRAMDILANRTCKEQEIWWKCRCV